MATRELAKQVSVTTRQPKPAFAGTPAAAGTERANAVRTYSIKAKQKTLRSATTTGHTGTVKLASGQVLTIENGLITSVTLGTS